MAIILLLALTVLAWVVLILPRQRELKRHQALMGQLAVGDEVMMTSGIYGTIQEIDGEYVQLEIADGLQIKIAKRSVAARVETPTSEGSEGSDTEPLDIESPGTDSTGADSIGAGAIGQTPVSEAESVPGQGEGGDEAVIDLDDEIDSARGNEA